LPSTNAYRIASLPGDGIGLEVTDAAFAVLDAATDIHGGIAFDVEILAAGAALYRDTGEGFPDKSRQAAAKADAIYLGAMGLPDVRYEDGTEIAPQLDLRQDLNLYAGVRPIRTYPGLPGPLAAPQAQSLDFVIVRESTEGLFAERTQGTVTDDQIARDALVITRPVCEKLFDFTFKLAERRIEHGRPGPVACIDKANVLASMAFFRKIFDERARNFPTVKTEHHYVDAAALELVRRPWLFNVMVAENMFGDIISDLAGGLMGSMGLAPSADIGDDHAVFQPAHGTAPDIAGLSKANPIAAILSGAMMLEWLGQTHNDENCLEAAEMIENAVTKGINNGDIKPYEFGGTDGTSAITNTVIGHLGG
jgi:3-isopropylmalate dehydrogenase